MFSAFLVKEFSHLQNKAKKHPVPATRGPCLCFVPVVDNRWSDVDAAWGDWHLGYKPFPSAEGRGVGRVEGRRRGSAEGCQLSVLWIWRGHPSGAGPLIKWLLCVGQNPLWGSADCWTLNTRLVSLDYQPQKGIDLAFLIYHCISNTQRPALHKGRAQ